jgi:hypothetical protein
MLWTKVKIVVSYVLSVAFLCIVSDVVARPPTTDQADAGSQTKVDQPDNKRKASQTGQVPDKGPAPQSRPEEKTFTFEMIMEPWSKVLDWYSDISGLPFTGKEKPVGNYTYISIKKKKHTLTEILDILNESLLPQKAILIRGEASFTFVVEGQRIDPAFLPLVRAEDLGKRGKTELVTTLVSLGKLSAKDLTPDFKALMGPFAQVVVVEKTNQLLLVDSAANLLLMHKLLEKPQEEPGKKKKV